MFKVLFFILIVNDIYANTSFIKNYTEEKIHTKSSKNDKIFIREYRYHAQSNDTELSAKIKTLKHLKILVSEEIGTTIESSLELVKTDKEKLFKQEINSVSVSLSKLKILEENWDSSFYYIKAKVSINEKQTLELLAEVVINKGYEIEINKLKNILDKKGIQLSILNQTIKDLKRKLNNSIPLVTIVGKTKAGFSDLIRTYGYYLGQDYVLKTITDKYPELTREVDIAKMSFNGTFGISLDTIKKFLDKNNYDFSHLNKKLSQFTPYSKDDSIKFINEVKLRAKGINIESPVIENLLLYNPMYNKYPEKEFKDNYKKTFKTDGRGKAKGISFEITVPQSWKSKEGYRPNIVQKFISQNGHGLVTALILIKDMPIPEDMTLTKNEIEEHFITEEKMKASEENMTISDYGKFSIENQPGYWKRINANLKRGTRLANMDILQYTLFYKNKIILIQFQTGFSLDGHKTRLNQKREYKTYKPLFDQILNSFILTDKYTEEDYNLNIKREKKYYIYKLFGDKFQTIFPSKPTIQEIPSELLKPRYVRKSLPYKYIKELNQKQIDKIVTDAIEEIKNSQPYIYTDNENKISYTSQNTPSNLEHKNYIWNGMKEKLDEIIKTGLKADNRKIISFSSSLDKYKDKYIAIYHSSYVLDNRKIYSSTKHIYYKDKVYKWNISYVNKIDKYIFDDYQHNVKVLQ